MQVTTEQVDPCKVELNIEVEADKVARTIDEVYGEFSQTTSVPGFRKGKAPRRILERYVSPESVRRMAVDSMVAHAYVEALNETGIEPYAGPEVEIVQFDADKPFIFKVMVPLAPKIELGEYKGIEVKRPEVNITDEDVDAQLKYLQESNATARKVEDRGIQMGDVAVAEIASTVEGQDKGAPRRSLIEVGSNVPGFDEKVVGLKPGEQRSFPVEYPKDFPEEELAGKTVDFDVNVESIRERQIPELNDEFAKTMGQFETLADLREDIRTRLTASAEKAADREVERKIVDEVVARSKVDFPDVLVDHDVSHDLADMQNRLDRQGMTLEQYLRQIGKTEEEFASELREQAVQGVRAGLVLGEISNAENVDVTDEEVDAEIERIAAESKATTESVETYIEARGGRPALKNSLLNRRILDFLKSVSSIK